MTARENLRACLSERRSHARNSLNYQYLTRALIETLLRRRQDGLIRLPND